MKTGKMLFQSIARGATILEVMISVLLLTFGVLALMAAQLRSVASLSEAENRSIVSQAAEALAEGMQANSSLETISKNGKISYYRIYKEYEKPPTSVMTVGDDSQKATVQNGLSGSGLTKKQVADQHIAEFEYVLKTQLTNVNILDYVICRDKTKPEAATYDNGHFDNKCDPANNDTDTHVIKVVWRMGNGKNDSSNDNNTTAYSYMLEVGR
ncbi:type IV pilus modification protein PilV [Kingella denitrificans]